MPVIAIVGAAAAWGLGGAAAIGGVIAGTATLAVTLTAVATVGATLGAIGAITHDKTLSTVGMVMGAVGGVGALAANAGVFGAEATTASLFGSDPVPMNVVAPDIAGDVAASNDLSSLANLPGLPESGATAAADAVDEAGNFAADSLLPSSAIDSATGAASGDVESLIKGASNSDAPPLPAFQSPTAPDATPPKFDVASSTSIAKSGDQSVDSSQLIPGQFSDNPNPGDTGLGKNGVTYTYDGKNWTPQTSFFGGLMRSPAAQYGLVQAAGAFLSGQFDPLKPAQIDALNAQATNNRATAALTTQQTQNMHGALPVASRVTGAPMPVTGTGVINNAPVTGQVAA